MTEITDFLRQVKKELEQSLAQRLDALPTQSTTLIDAMRYSLLMGGKRLRPALIFASANVVNPNAQGMLDCACAIEAIHTYSLVHDDLPAMDDDDMRRGQPSCHKAFGEAQAILAGDALQTLAFTWLAQSSILNSDQKVAAITCLSSASGAQGMVQGQAIDLASTNQTLSLDTLEQMHSLKTGALIESAVSLGAICAQATALQKLSLNCYARAIGLAFQVQDDILDVTSTTEQLGKQVGSDASLNKPTYVTLLGVDGAKQKCEQLITSAFDHVSVFGKQADILRAMANYIIQRKN